MKLIKIVKSVYTWKKKKKDGSNIIFYIKHRPMAIKSWGFFFCHFFSLFNFSFFFLYTKYTQARFVFTSSCYRYFSQFFFPFWWNFFVFNLRTRCTARDFFSLVFIFFFFFLSPVSCSSRHSLSLPAAIYCTVKGGYTACSADNRCKTYAALPYLSLP